MRIAPKLSLSRTSVACLTLLVTTLSTGAPARAAGILWNRLGSAQQVLNSDFGPDLAFYPGGEPWPNVVGNPAYTPGVFGDALTIGTGAYAVQDRQHTVVWNNVHEHLNPNRGTIDVWFKQTQNPIEFSHGVYRIFDGAYGLGSGINFTSEAANGPALRFGMDFGGTYTGVSTNISALNGTWTHLAGVWDRDGIGGTDDTIRLYVNGQVVASTTVAGWGTTVGQRADIGGGNDADIAGKFAIDNLRVYDTALTNFDHRFVEAIPEPASLGLLAAGGLALFTRRRSGRAG